MGPLLLDSYILINFTPQSILILPDETIPDLTSARTG